MTTRQNISSGGPYEETVGYSRAVRVGNVVHVAGTTAALPDGTIHAPEDAYAQSKRALQTIEAALTEAGACLSDVVRTRLFVTDIERDGADVARAHGEAFAHIRPVTAMYQVVRLMHPQMRVEIEAEAIITTDDAKGEAHADSQCLAQADAGQTRAPHDL